MRQISIILLTALFPLCLCAQEELTVVRGDCMPAPAELSSINRAAQTPRRLPAVKDVWDANRIYRQLVVLVNFEDTVFVSEDPKAYYERVFNETGYNGGVGAGCVADYYRDQSYGLCNLQFDIFGPYTVAHKAQPIENPTEKTRNYGQAALREALLQVVEGTQEMDFSVYDWNGDGKVEQVIFVYAGWPGNSGTKTYGHIWPNTSAFSTVTAKDGTKMSNYTASGEKWPTKSVYYCGIGTICHEFTHSLGLPDIYPTANNSAYSVCDEWDLMDGGNFTNLGWCPPNLTPQEKMLLGWLTPIDLTEPTIITDLKPSAEGGEVYRIMHSDSEYLLLENRQQRGWDLGAPGKGLVIYHVDYDAAVWSGNRVNNDPDRLRFDLVHADNMDYSEWDFYIDEKGLGRYKKNIYLNNRHLSTSPYPWTTDSTDFVNSELTETSVPAPKMHEPNLDGEMELNKPITNIQMSEEGLVSFNFMVDAPSGIKDIQVSGFKAQEYYDLQGRCVKTPQRGNLYIVRTPQGTRKHLLR